MQPFTTLDAVVVPIDRPNVDTDALIPKQFMKSIARTGFGDNLFDEWRYLDRGEPGQRWRIDLPAQTLTPEGGAAIPFDIQPDAKRRLLLGLDAIGLTLAQADSIRAHEARRRATEPWLFT